MSARLFVAVELADADRAALAAWAAEAVGGDRGLRLVDPALLHLTLAFLGHRALDEVAPLQALVEGLGGRAPAPLTTAGSLWLSPSRPHVLTVAVADGTGALGRLHARTWDAVEALLDVRRERRPYRPHVTVARLRRGWPAPSRRLPDLPARELRAASVTLYRSWLGGGPARYEPLARAPLSALS